MTDAQRALSLLVADARLGGMIVSGDAEALLAALPGDMSVRRVPVGVDAERLTGALDVAATLATGRPVMERGLIDAAAGGFLIVPMAERLSPEVAGLLARALDEGTVRVILLDSGCEDERISEALTDRVAFWVDMVVTSEPAENPDSADIAREIVGLADMLGVASLRPAVFALAVAQATDLGTAARLVLAPRATRWPEPEPEPEAAPPSEGETQAVGQMADVVLEAVRAILPVEAIAAIVARNARATGQARGSRARAKHRGRPIGSRSGLPRGGARLALIATLRAAAPWQRMRGRTDRILIRKSDLRIRLHQARSASTTIFAVDASGSAAAARMAEAKGTVELLLTRAYAERAQVALIAFRGEGAEILLPPTRSLTRARRLLADLPGGGATPLSAGLYAARTLALAERARDRTPRIVVLTDGRANMPLTGAQGEAESAARAIAREGFPATLIDISARPRAEGRAVAAAMAGRYIALPRADARAVSAEL